jgi:hypothetical protein
MAEIISHPGCYPYSSTDGYNYKFTTLRGDHFMVSFKRTWVNIFEITRKPTDGVDIYEMIFERLEIIDGTFDKYISKTILYIGAAFTNSRRVIFYAADNPTKHDKELFRLYDIWYNFLIKENADLFGYDLQRVRKLNKVVKYTNYMIYFSCFFLPESVSDYNIEKLFTYILHEIYPNSIITEYHP